MAALGLRLSNSLRTREAPRRQRLNEFRPLAERTVRPLLRQPACGRVLPVPGGPTRARPSARERPDANLPGLREFHDLSSSSFASSTPARNRAGLRFLFCHRAPPARVSAVTISRVSACTTAIRRERETVHAVGINRMRFVGFDSDTDVPRSSIGTRHRWERGRQPPAGAPAERSLSVASRTSVVASVSRAHHPGVCASML